MLQTCSAPGTGDNVGDLMKNNAPVGGTTALGICKVPTFARGVLPRGSQLQVHYYEAKKSEIISLGYINSIYGEDMVKFPYWCILLFNQFLQTNPYQDTMKLQA